MGSPGDNVFDPARGKILKIVPTEIPNKLDNLIDRKDFIRGDPEDLVHLDWSSAWRP